MKFSPHDYQRYCIQKMLSAQALGLFLDMGLGKTVIALTAVNDLKYNRFAVGRILVIAPKKVAESTWAREADKWDHLKHLRVIKVLGSAAKRIQGLNTPGDIYVINRENVPWLVEQYRNAWPFDTVIVDELSSFKSHTAKRFKALTWVRPHINRIYGLTGTPAPNGLIDIWAQVYLLDQGKRLEAKFGQYRERYFDPDKRTRDQIFSYAPKPGAELIIQRKISDICVSMKAEDYLQLPECITVDHTVELDPTAQKAYATLEREALLQVDEDIIDAGTAAVLTNKLLQLCNGAVYDDSRAVVGVHDCKLEAFMELVEGLNGAPALVFYGFQHDRDRILKVLQPMVKQGLRVRELKTDDDAVAWNAGQVDILLTHPASSAYGLNLQDGGNQVIWFGMNWSLELYQQANKRLHRQGQKAQRVIIHRLLVAGGVDEDIATVLEKKDRVQSDLLDGLKARIKAVKEGSIHQ